MKREDLITFKNKKIRIILKTNFRYTCCIEFLNEDSVHVLDKFQQRHIFDYDQIAEVSEVQE